MGAEWLIVADDLTGAADCATAFARRGVAAAVGWGDHDRSEKAGERLPVFAYDAGSRGLPAPEAAARHRDVLRRFLGRDTLLFKKIDSTLRGQPAAETAAAMAALRARSGSAFAVLAPAFPATGRTTEAGRVRVDGGPLERTEVWRRDHSYPDADLVEVLATAGIAGETIPLSLVRAGAGALRAALAAAAAKGDVVAVCDALTSADLDRIVEASLPADPSVMFIGSAGLAHALAAAVAGERCEPIVLPATTKGSLIVVGSLAAASRAAARTLAAARRVRYVPVEPAVLLDADAVGERDAIGKTVIDGLRAGDDVLVEILMDGRPDMAIGPRLADALGELLRPALPFVGGLAATGGETAAALLTRFGVNGIRLVGEVEAGVALGLTLGDIALPIVTKAGAFGDEDSLTRITRRLRVIRREGTLA